MSDYDRDLLARKRYEEQVLSDSRIMGKVNAHHAQEFRERFPGQVEQCMRLVFERLQYGLRKDGTKPLSTDEVRDLAEAGEHLYNIYRSQQ